MDDSESSLESSRTGRWLAQWTGFGIGAIVLAFMSGREMEAANPVALATIGLVVALGVICSHHAAMSASKKYGAVATWASLIFAVLAGLIIMIVGGEADANLTANLARCQLIQDDMLAAKPRRSDGPDIFQALGCHPQGVGTVAFPPHDVTSPRRDEVPSSAPLKAGVLERTARCHQGVKDGKCVDEMR